MSWLSICEQRPPRSARQKEFRGFSRLNRHANEIASKNKTTWNESKLYRAQLRPCVMHFSFSTQTHTYIHTLVNCNPFHYDEAQKHAWVNDSAWGCVYRRVCVSECVCAWGKYRRQIYKPVCCNWAFGIARGLKDITWSQKWERESEKERERERERYTLVRITITCTV